jgi:hypothetical protein
MHPRSTTLGDPIDRHTREQYARKSRGRSKSADLARLKRDVRHHKVPTLISRHVTEYFEGRNVKGAGFRFM